MHLEKLPALVTLCSNSVLMKMKYWWLNESLQKNLSYIHVWYVAPYNQVSEWIVDVNHQRWLLFIQGSVAVAELLVPVMTGRWSRFAISVSGPTINLFVYCHNYTVTTITRSKDRLKFSDDSLVLVGHAGGVIQQQFKVCSQNYGSETII